jgi:chromosomal replication initiation ATPase DnaA
LPKQLPLPLGTRVALTREDFVPSLASAAALAFIDSWPDWTVRAAALYGPSGSGKSHLAAIWAERSNAQIVSSEALVDAPPDASRPIVVEDVDISAPSDARDAALFALLEHARAPILLTGHEPPAQWAASLPDLSSRFSALLAFGLWAPDDALLAAIARKLFNDRQLTVPDAVIARMVQSLERSPSAIRDFVAHADAKALSEGRAINPALVREMLAERDLSPS